MKYKIGLYLTILISAGVYCPSAFASITEQLYSGTTTNQNWQTYGQTFQIIGSNATTSQVKTTLKIHWQGGNSDFLAQLCRTSAANPTGCQTQLGSKYYASDSGNGGAPTLPAAEQDIKKEFTFNFGTDIGLIATATPYLLQIQCTGASTHCSPYGSDNAASYPLGLFNKTDPNIADIAFQINYSSTTDSVTPSHPVSETIEINPVVFSGTYNNNSGNWNLINISLNYLGKNGDGLGGYITGLGIPIAGTIGNNLPYSGSFQLPAGYYTYSTNLFNTNTGSFSVDSPFYSFRVLQDIISNATSTPYGLTITMATGSIQLPILQGIATSTCTGDLITDFGCNFKNGLIIFTNALIVPDTSSLGYISSAFSKFQSVFPFSIFFTFQTYSQANLSLPQQGQTLTIPQLGTFTPQIDILSSSTLSNFFGTSVTDDYFNFWQNVIWISTFISMVYVII